MNSQPLSKRNRSRPVLLLVVNVAWYFNLHRLALAKAAQKAGFEVHVATAPDTVQDVSQIERAGLVYHPLNMSRGRWRPIEDLCLILRLVRLHRRIRPDLVHHITIKPVLFGTLAARVARVRGIVNAMSGLGFVFIATGFRAVVRRRLVMLAYRVLFACKRVRVIFENSDDLHLFISRAIVDRSRAVVIRGVGVDPRRFPRRKEPLGMPLVVLAGRMLWDKGVREFCEAAAALRAEGLPARFALVGPLDPENPAAVPASWLEEQQRSNTVEWWGHRSNMAEVYSQASVVCLPSYREGLPTVLVEAGASGCAIVATDVPGCREVVSDSVTGLLVPPRNADALAAALRRLIIDSELRSSLAANAFNFVVNELSEDKITQMTLRLYRDMLAV